ncbi:thiamine phosphate synthase [Bacillus sp. ISL-41]|uniref:thiamine phosphate synthase n=1 Tax=Bacillus sp. ISL-41 TaxID=2819127 RepID=UPI001BECBE3B|nr:thiamine phosphate synthase [Bacillus sp. ISL-41]MBT2640827.1 thiamine phosphate synthase [Bacillus sp. ISL-41]
MARISPEQMRSLLKLYFIAGSTNCFVEPVRVLEDAIRGGITIFQYREKGEDCLDNFEKLELGKRLQKVCRENGIPFIVNDDIELALELDADGIHIGQEDEDAAQVREKIGDKILGVSVHNLEEAEKAKLAGADYYGVGPIFPTATKKDTRAVQGTVLLEQLKYYGIPIVGIGGINGDNAGAVMDAGADGVSVITAISQAEDVHEAAATLKKLVYGGKK